MDGGTLQLTINRDLQWYLQQMIAEQVQNMGAKGGTITVVEVKTGKIRAAAEYPTVDPNDVRCLRGREPLQPASSPTTFEPGSTFKATHGGDGASTPAVTTLTSTIVASSSETFPNGARATTRSRTRPTTTRSPVC